MAHFWCRRWLSFRCRLTVLSRTAGRQADDQLLDQFLGFLACDMASHPERLQAVDARLVQRLQSLVGGIDVDLGSSPSAYFE